MTLTADQGQEVLGAIDRTYASVLAKAQQNIADLQQGFGWRAILVTITGGQDFLRQQELQRQLGTVQQMGDQIELLRGMLSSALVDDAKGERWAQAAQNFYDRMKDADGFIASPSPKEILSRAVADVPLTLAGIVPWWGYAAAAAAVVLFVALRRA